ncbi:pentatricopeptide repeat-containing protein At3g29230 [Ricinus communis]|uniref:pentatricopeptide repeat-containing protein At3g29230 n=1 Tax=Ricinus communis TaxID=3988 RepID=UPI00201A4452|nr:pentatricopeptide repeat-containing protein At3g29230 [Ricinus communis]
MSRPVRMSLPTRAPTWVSTRRLFEEKLQDLHKCTDFNHIKEVHAQIIKRNLHNDLYVAPKLISAFSLCHQMNLAVNVFNQIQDPNVHLYNTLIRAHVQNSQSLKAFATFFDMQKNGLFADNFTYPFLLKACNGKGWLPTVQMIHCHVEKYGFFGDLFVPNSLIDSYSKCGLLGVNYAMKLFMEMGEKDLVSWNSMIGGLVKAGDLGRARKLFDEMAERDAVSWNTILDGYVKAGEMSQAFNLFEKMPERNVVSWSTMVSGYCKTGDMEMARMLFDKMPFKNLVTWTIIISGFAEKGLAKEATTLYNQMEAAGLKPDDGTLISILAACAESGLLVLGKKVHASIKKIRIKCSVNVSNALVDMYAKCGRVDKALSIFNEMSMRDLVSWNCMLQGLAMHGHGEKAIQLFSKMQQEGFKPDKVTLIAILCACTHAGFVDQGLSYFNSMERDHGIVPHIEHYGCMIDLLGRGGRLEEAFRLVQSMPMEPNDVIWGTLLGACRVHNAVPLAEKVLDRLITLEQSDPGNYSMLSNIFAAAGDWNSVANMRLQMKSTGVQKPSGASSIELDDEVHEFTVFDKSHPKTDKIYQILVKLGQDLKQVAYAPEADL